MELPPNIPPQASPEAAESPVEYDPKTDPLKSEVDGILAAYRHKKGERVFNPKTKMFEKPEEDYPNEEISRIRYPNGLHHPQYGNFAVTATFLDDSRKFYGGGWVESFEDKYDAERCAYIIRTIDTGHNPEVVSNKDW